MAPAFPFLTSNNGWHKRALILMQRTATTLPCRKRGWIPTMRVQLVRLQQRRQPAAVLCNTAPHCHTTWKQPSSPGHLPSLSGHFNMPLPVSRPWLSFGVSRLLLSPVSAPYLCMWSAHCQSARHWATPLTFSSEFSEAHLWTGFQKYLSSFYKAHL